MDILNLLQQSEMVSIISVLGLFFTIFGIIIAFCFQYIRKGPKPVYQISSRRLIGREEHDLPDDVTVIFKNNKVKDLLTKSHIIFWNAGRRTLRGEDIVTSDPLRISIENGEILRAHVIHQPRIINKIEVHKKNTTSVIWNFDYLDSKDGAVIEIIHTASERNPKIEGNIKGIPQGIKNWGSLPRRGRIISSKRMEQLKRPMWAVMIFLGICFICIACLAPNKYKPFFIVAEGCAKCVQSLSRHYIFLNRYVVIFLGIAYIINPLFYFWSGRRSYPKKLHLPEIGDRRRG